jgi:hypothetical protein
MAEFDCIRNVRTPDQIPAPTRRGRVNNLRKGGHFDRR